MDAVCKTTLLSWNSSLSVRPVARLLEKSRMLKVPEITSCETACVSEYK